MRRELTDRENCREEREIQTVMGEQNDMERDIEKNRHKKQRVRDRGSEIERAADELRERTKHELL